MQCGRARKCLYVKAEWDGEVIQAEAHVANCQACQQFFDAEERLRLLLRARAERATPSAGLRDGILRRIAEEGRRQRDYWGLPALLRRRVVVVPGLVLLTVVTIFAGLLVSRQKARLAAEHWVSLLVADHVKMSGATQIECSECGILESWFNDKIDFAVRLPCLSDVPLVGARLCNLQGRHTALIFYKSDQTTISLFVLDGEGIDLLEDDLLASDGKRCLARSESGINVVMWRERGIVYGLVSDAQPTNLLQTAERFYRELADA